MPFSYMLSFFVNSKCHCGMNKLQIIATDQVFYHNLLLLVDLSTRYKYILPRNAKIYQSSTGWHPILLTMQKRYFNACM